MPHALRITFDVRQEFEADITRFLELRKQLYDELSPSLAALDRDPSSGDGGAVYALTDRTCRALADLVARMRDHPVGYLASGRLEPEPTVGADAAEWFVVSPVTSMEIDGGSGGLLDVRADRVKGREHLRRYSEVPLVSEKFVAFVRENHLTGVDFLWCRDKGKYQAPQWYAAFGDAFLGHGVDHPWFDPATRGAHKAGGYLNVQPTDPAWIIGVRTFDASQLRPDVGALPTDPAALAALLDQLRQTQTRYGLSILAPPAVLRAALPDADFAYRRVAQPGEDDGIAYRTVRLCARAVTRRKLIEAKLATPEDFRPIEVLDAPPLGIPAFDAPGAAPLPPVFSDKELAALRPTVEKQRAKFAAKPRPPAPVVAPPIAKLVPRLKRLLKKQETAVAKGATPASVAAAGQAIGYPVPPRWAELLCAIDGFDIDNCAAIDGTAELHVAPAKDLPEENAAARVMLGDHLAPTLLAVALTDLGDRVLLDTSKSTNDGDCPVLFVNHETGETEMTWPGVGLFLSDAIEPAGE